MNNQELISKFGEEILRNGKIISGDETPDSMILRITNGIKDVEEYFNEENIEEFIFELQKKLREGKIIPNTTIMTNLGRHSNKPLSACTVPDIDLRSDYCKLKEQVDNIHLSGMGTGFNFDNLDEPIRLLIFLNNISVDLEESGKQERPVGNMGIMSIYNKYIENFIKIKSDADKKGEKWNFNLSVSIDDNFMLAVKNKETIELTNGKKVCANNLLNQISEMAHKCADPGIIFMDRMQDGNTTPKIGKYISVAPCGETGLTKGETCNFASLNLSNFITLNGEIDYKGLEEVVFLLIRYLDDIVEYNLDKYIDESSKYIMEQKRKVGIGVCGVADMFLKLKIPYGSKESIKLSENIMSFINFKSKQASINLAKKRGSFLNFKESLYLDDYILKRYGNYETDKVLSKDWEKLNIEIKKYGLRNSNTVILPPTGRSALVFGVSQQIEPIFSLLGIDGKLNKELLKENLSLEVLEDVKDTGILQYIIQDKVFNTLRDVYKTAREISLNEHLDILQAFSKFTDEAVSKTINLPNNATVGCVKKIYLDCYKRGLNGVTIYRNGCKEGQPIKMSV